MKLIQLAFLMLLLSRCQNNNTNKINTANKKIANEIVDIKDKKHLIENREIEKQEYLDSIKLDKILLDALKISNQNIKKKAFVNSFEDLIDGKKIRTEINLNNHFSDSTSHLIIKRHYLSTLYIDIYLKDKRTFRKVASHNQWTLEYVNDTIQDVNGDGEKDFVVNWYGSTGCCLKAFSDVYVLKKDNKTFSERVTLINPTFSPKEKVVRGICYGHPGETELYKYKWNLEKLDTIEYVSYQKDGKEKKTGKVIVSNKQFKGNNYKILKVLNKVPSEYKTIEGYDWFKGW